MVLIGDGFAEGLGDWVVMGGMAGVTRVLEKQAGSDEKVGAIGWYLLLVVLLLFVQQAYV